MKRLSALAMALAAASSFLAGPGHAQTAGTNFFKMDGDKIFYRVTGSGPAMLLVHGFPLSGRLFDEQVAAFAKSFTVITPDLPGFGRSTTGTVKQTDTHYAAEMLALLTSLNANTAIIGGHSMGGQIVLNMYRQQPARFRGMILFDTNPLPANLIERGEWPAFGRMAEKLGSASIAPGVVAVMVTGDSLVHKASLQTLITDIVSKAEAYGVAGGANALVTRPDYSDVLGKITVPTLVVEGRDDPVYPLPVSQALAMAIHTSTLAVIPGTAHASMLQSGPAVNAAITSWVAYVP